ncbi:hypothetical protein BDR26DRAFT_417322 [Obelidium mucronatum]|nr:hypothetical protein BDR26DRAFT_417322 [Obelidium mucronatum]
MCSRISAMAEAYKKEKPPTSIWRFSIRKATIVLNIETSTETEFITKFQMRKEGISVMVQEAASCGNGELRVRVYTVQISDFIRELGRDYGKSLCFTRSFPDEHEFIGSVTEIKNGNVAGSVQIHPNSGDDTLAGTLYLVKSTHEEKDEKRGRSKSCSARNKDHSKSRQSSIKSDKGTKDHDKHKKPKSKSRNCSDDEGSRGRHQSRKSHERGKSQEMRSRSYRDKLRDDRTRSSSNEEKRGKSSRPCSSDSGDDGKQSKRVTRSNHSKHEDKNHNSSDD